MSIQQLLSKRIVLLSAIILRWRLPKGFAAGALARLLGFHGEALRLFDADWYLRRHPDVAAAGLDPLVHYIQQGAAFGYDPHPMFSSRWYLERYPDVAAAKANPFIHYLKDGGFEGRDPHPLFDTSWYLERHPDAAASGLNPLVHYIERGVLEDYQPGPLFSTSDGWDMDYSTAATLRAKYDWEIGPNLPTLVLKQSRIKRFRVSKIPVWALIRLGKACYNRSLFFLASILYRAALPLARARREQLLGWLAKCEVRRKRFDKAFDWFIRRIHLLPSSEAMIRTVARPPIARGLSAHGKIVVVTSFMPRRIEAQRAALQSWRDAGVSVVSVNSSSEAAALREHFPDVTFRIVARPFVDKRGRPCVPIAALIEAAKESHADICGIVNSDIEFRGDSTFFNLVRQEVPGSLIFGNRIDYPDAARTGGQAFRLGYDFFFWQGENSALLEDNSMVLGLPWWDFWLPLHAYGQGLRTKRFVTCSMTHIAHPIGYDSWAYVMCGHLFIKTLAGLYSRWSSDHVSPERAFLHRLFATATAINVDRHPDAALSRIGIVCDLVNCLIDALSETVILPDAQLARGALDLV
jgi:hypothetical protein